MSILYHIQVSIVEPEAGMASMRVAAACCFYLESLYIHGSMFIDPSALVAFNGAVVWYIIWI